MNTLLTDISFWHWLILGGVLLTLELVTGGGFLLWVGIASFLVALLLVIIPSLYWPWQLLCFALLSVVACFFWWRYLREHNEKNDQPMLNRRADQYIGRTFTLETDIHNGRGRVKVGDTIWRVEGEDMPKGSKVVVVGVDSVLLKVERAKDE